MLTLQIIRIVSYNMFFRKHYVRVIKVYVACNSYSYRRYKEGILFNGAFKVIFAAYTNYKVELEIRFCVINNRNAYLILLQCDRRNVIFILSYVAKGIHRNKSKYNERNSLCSPFIIRKRRCF